MNTRVYIQTLNVKSHMLHIIYQLVKEVLYLTQLGC